MVRPECFWGGGALLAKRKTEGHVRPGLGRAALLVSGMGPDWGMLLLVPVLDGGSHVGPPPMLLCVLLQGGASQACAGRTRLLYIISIDNSPS